MDPIIIEEEKIRKALLPLGSNSLESDKIPVGVPIPNKFESRTRFVDVKRTVTPTGFRISAQVEPEESVVCNPLLGFKHDVIRVKEEPDVGCDSNAPDSTKWLLGSKPESIVQQESDMGFDAKASGKKEKGPDQVKLEIRVKDEPFSGFESKVPVKEEMGSDIGSKPDSIVQQESDMDFDDKVSVKEETSPDYPMLEILVEDPCLVPDSKLSIKEEMGSEPENIVRQESDMDFDDKVSVKEETGPDCQTPEIRMEDPCPVPDSKVSTKEEMVSDIGPKLDNLVQQESEMGWEDEVPVKEETGTDHEKLETRRKEEAFSGFESKVSMKEEMGSDIGSSPDNPVKPEQDSGFDSKVFVEEEKGPNSSTNQSVPTNDLKQEIDGDDADIKVIATKVAKTECNKPQKKVTVVGGVVVEDGDFPEGPEWYLVGGTMVTGLSTSKGRKLVDNEIVYFNFSSLNVRYSTQWIVRFSTKRFGEIGRLPMEWSKCVVPLVNSGKVKVLGRCIATPTTLTLMAEILLYVSFYIHRSIFTEIDKFSWKLDGPQNIDSTIYPLLTLFKLLKITPYQKAEFTPEELNSRKRMLNLEVGSDEAVVMLPTVKRRKGQCPEESKDEQAISESSLNKLVGAVDTYDLEEMEPPDTLTCDLRSYQKQALFWMSESEKGIDVEQAAKTLHPCWMAYRICDEYVNKRASSIYVNIFSGEATTKLPTATQMARGGILADAMGLGKTVMTIALILARRGKGISENQELVNGNTIKKKDAHINGRPKVKGGTLIVCPMALLGQWKDELETHSKPESISIFVHYGGIRTNNPKVISEYDVVLTTYGVLTASYKQDIENSIYHKVEWYRVVLDEAHTIKAWKTQGAQAAFMLSSHCRWCLTGTPLQNNLEDLYSLLCFLHVEPWCNWAWWNKLIQKPYENGDYRGLKLVKAILRPLMLRRTKDTKDKKGRPILVLPPTDIQIIECAQSEAEHDFYDALFRRSKVQFDQFVAQGKVLHNYANILELLLRLRQCCNHPFLVMSRADSQQYTDLNKLARRFLDNNSASTYPNQKAPTRAYVEEIVQDIQRGENTECPICWEFADDPVLTPCAHRMCRECLHSSWRTPVTGLCPICRTVLKKTDLITCPTESKFRVDVEKNWKESSKVSKLLECLERIRRSGSGEKSIVFSQWTSFLDLLEIPLRRRGIGYLRFDGKLVQKQRERVLKEFSETKEKMVLLMSLKAGGVGLNLTAASNVFLMDPWWNPAVEEQAIMRIHRIGQKRTVVVRRFIVKDTVEERLQQVQARKQRMIAGALTDEEFRSARLEELKMLFR
ncbi:SNF2_N domain-containing protein/Helicase_C domain-containing protein/HIRAN domain-containing protein/zf-C3HC4_2 domain-containing protein [Cephalotus follicularis]|uniref:SNF2_N domain-containing protein/Helicase_C domain-containing protein/HIRAN domain-containing protein/zf-C3HC4_2 domain-containing protein n=1 Tax=Cephalotus follicularis TaxID=3775 RepID=A0A1Q3CQN2_CEPFO|nr:SNF2_N domain-containing protein/Helicase_C domain-containing protein/HIRAN domain-containing protein/zf-C3HC4_2 domain-containing protein [Cephalotus follicularis]